MKEKKTALSPEGEVLDRLRMFEESLRELLRLRIRKRQPAGIIPEGDGNTYIRH